MWKAHLFRKTDGRLVSQLLSSIFDLRTSMTLKVFCAPSAILHGTMMGRGANTTKAGVRLFYEQLMKALPDLEIEVKRRHVTDEAILVEVVIRGTHLGGWRGLPATGQHVEFPLCGVYTFDPDDRLAGEKIYYDRGTVLKQLGVFHEPRSLLGQISILATHPTTIVRAFARKLLRR